MQPTDKDVCEALRKWAKYHVGIPHPTVRSRTRWTGHCFYYVYSKRYISEKREHCNTLIKSYIKDFEALLIPVLFRGITKNYSIRLQETSMTTKESLLKFIEWTNKLEDDHIKKEERGRNESK